MKNALKVLIVLLLLLSFVACNKKTSTTTTQKTSNEAKTDSKKITVGLLCIGDENDQGYSYNFIQGRDEATKKLAKEGINVEWITKFNIGEDSTCRDANIEAAEEGCKIVINNSYGFEPFMLQVAKDYPNIEFVSCTNQASGVDNLKNTHNAFANIYEGRYVAGVVAGLKLQEMIDKGDISANEAIIGYVGAYSFAEVISGFSSYFLGARSVCPTVKMKVSFVGSWSDATAEADAAASLIDAGCVMISQHSDNTTPATTAQNRKVFHTGYNADMTSVAPSASLVSTRIDWSVYFYEIIKNYVEGKEIPQDWCKGMADDAVVMTHLNEKICAANTRSKMNDAIAKIKNGTTKVFDLSSFTINGKLAVNDEMYDSFAAVKKNMVYENAFHESTAQSAPYFVGRIDGIEWLNAAYGN